MPQFGAFPASDASLHGPGADRHDLGPDALGFERAGHFRKRDEGVPLAPGASVDKQYFHGYYFNKDNPCIFRAGGGVSPPMKKGDSHEPPSLSNLTGNYSAFLQQGFSAQAFVESHCSAQQAFVESHFSVQAAASVVAAASAAAPSAAFLFELPQQLTIATAAITTTKEKIFFIALNV